MKARALLTALALAAPAAAAAPTVPAAVTPAAKGEAQATDETTKDPLPALPAWGIGVGPIAGIGKRKHIDHVFVPLGLSLHLHWGTALSDQLGTGVAVRGSWLLPPKVTVSDLDEASNLEKLELAVHWYQHWGSCTALRFGVGPRVTALLGDDTVNDAALFGAEGSAEVGWHFDAGPGPRRGLWVGLIAAHAIGGTSDNGSNRERETTFEVALTLALDQLGRPAPRADEER